MGFEGVVAVCSRGLIHSRTSEGIEINRLAQAGTWTVLYTHDDPIPKAQNKITDRALALQPRWIWYVEEDIVVPPEGLDVLLGYAKQGFRVVTANYQIPLEDGTTVSAVRYERGVPLYGGMGCLLVQADVFYGLKQPFFEAAQWSHHSSGWVRMKHGGGVRPYGGQDIHLYATLAQAGIGFTVAGFRCGHARVERPGEPGVNDGCHKVEVL